MFLTYFPKNLHYFPKNLHYYPDQALCGADLAIPQDSSR